MPADYSRPAVHLQRLKSGSGACIVGIFVRVGGDGKPPVSLSDLLRKVETEISLTDGR